MIHNYKYCLEHIGEQGEVEEVNSFLVKVKGLPGAKIGEGITFETGEHGRIMELEPDRVTVLVLSGLPLKPKTKAARTGKLLTISCGQGLLGHIVNALGYTIGGHRNASEESENRIIESPPSGITSRAKITEFFETGVALIDTVVPLGKGQRELIIGDRKTGKTHFLLQSILAQARHKSVCIYAALGKKKTEIKAIEAFLEKENFRDQMIIVAADSDSSPGEIFLAPFTAMTLAEYFRDQGQDVFLVLDDLTSHAKYYREIALLSGRFPSRESYPGDIFYLHSQLLERAGNFKGKDKPVSITCFPLAESVVGDITGFIPTNLMSMTDGHIYFDGDLYFAGRRPAVNVFISVTRVGRQTQTPLWRDLGRRVLGAIKESEEAQRFLRFGPEISGDLQLVLKRGQAMTIFYNQVGYWSLPLPVVACGLALLWDGDWDGKGAKNLATAYKEQPTVKVLINALTSSAMSLADLKTVIQDHKSDLLKLVK